MSHRFANLVSLNRNYLSRLIHLLNYLNISYIPVLPVTVQHITVRPVTVLVFTHNFTLHSLLSQFARTCLHLSINISTLYMGPKTQTTHTSMFIDPYRWALAAVAAFKKILSSSTIQQSKHIRCTQKELTHKNGSHLKIQKQNTKDSQLETSCF